MLIKSLPTASIVEPSTAVRSTLDPDALRELADDIRQVGLINPITVTAVDDHYEVVAGHRRFAACRLLDLPEITCVILAPDSGISDLVKLHENYCREAIAPLDEALYFQRIMSSGSLQVDQLAARIGLSRSYVASRLQLLALPDIIGQALADNMISMSVALVLGRCPNPEYLAYYLNQAVESGANTRTVQAWIGSCPLSAPVVDAPSEPGASPQSPAVQLPAPHWSCFLCGASKPVHRFSMRAVCFDCTDQVAALPAKPSPPPSPSLPEQS